MIDSMNQVMVKNSDGIFFYPKHTCKVCGDKYFADDPSQRNMSTSSTCTRCTVAFTKNDPTDWPRA